MHRMISDSTESGILHDIDTEFNILKLAIEFWSIQTF